jgi:hypothetical protein
MLLNKQATANYQLVEILVPANSPNQKINIPDQPLLRDKAIEKIEFYDQSSMTVSPNNYPIVTPTNNIFFTFADQSGFEFIQNASVYDYIGTSNTDGTHNAKNGTFNIGLRKIVFPKSYFTYSNSSPVGTAYALLLGIYYR